MMFFLCFPLLLCYGKFVSRTVTVSPEEEWKYLTKFAVDIGSGSYLIKAQLLHPIEPNSDVELGFYIGVYLDKQWTEALSQRLCEGKMKSALAQRLLTIPKDGQWSDPISGSMTQRVRPYFWFFALADCSGRVNQKLTIKLEIMLQNSDGSHFSLEDRNMAYLYTGVLLLSLGLLSVNSLHLLHRFQKLDQIDRPSALLIVSICFQIVSVILALIQYWLFSYNGKGVIILSLFSQILDLGGQLIITFMLVAVSAGWILKFREFTSVTNMTAISLVVMLLDFLIGCFNRLADDAHNKFSGLEGNFGEMLIVFRLLLFGLFVFNMKDLYEASQGVMQTIILQFAFVSSLYFLSIPALALISRLFAEYLRNKIVSVCNFFLQMLAFLVLARLFNEKSAYHKVSTLSASVLPGSKQW